MGSSWNEFVAVLQMINIVLFFFCRGASSHNVTIVNDCPFTIFPLLRDYRNGTISDFDLPKGRSRSLKASTQTDLLLFSRTNCQFVYGSDKPKCNHTTHEPMTTVVFNFRGNGTDEYHVHTLLGFNLAVSVEAIGGSGSNIYSCSKAGCIGDVKNWCPQELRVRGGRGCRTACQLYKSPEYCCTQEYSTPSTCKPTHSSSAFMEVCPRSINLPYNTDYKTSKFTCEGADYIVRYCPPGGTFSTIELGGQLRSTDRLVSPNGAFMLGFYGEKYGYLGIWYKDNENTKVWVENLFGPTVSTSGAHALSINLNTGDLIITAGGKTLRTITDVRIGPNPNVRATLGDDGRLRLIDKSSGTVLFQTSFKPIIPPGNTLKFAWAPAATVFVSFLLIILLCKKSNIEREGEYMKNTIIQATTNLRIYEYDSIVDATNSFSDENELGRGGFGPVYKGTLQGGEEIAVKTLSKTSKQGPKEFVAEITAIVKAKHSSLVQVQGCCVYGSELMLVYEYMHNKSLDYHLYDEARRRDLNWSTRKIIIQTVAEGLLYLHNLQIIHRDLKASNILLDQNMNAKISDFGVARLLSPDDDKAWTGAAVGTMNYMAPEYQRNKIFSIKSDLYSFGVLMLEVVSGMSALGEHFPDETKTLVEYAWNLWDRGEILKLKDPLLLSDVDVDDKLSRIIDISLLCVQEKPDDRPTTSAVYEMLTNDVQLPKANAPGFLVRPTTMESLLEAIGVDRPIETRSASSNSPDCVKGEASKQRFAGDP